MKMLAPNGMNAFPASVLRTARLSLKYARLAAMIAGNVLTMLGLAACTGSEPVSPFAESFSPSKASAPPTNRVSRDVFDSSAIEINVPAGKWAMVRLDFGDLVDGYGAVLPIMASNPQPGAVPWTAYSAANRRGQLPAAFSFTAHRSDIADLSTFSFNITSTPGSGDELVLVVGSMHADSRFYIGGDPGNIDLFHPSNLAEVPDSLLFADYSGEKYEAQRAAALDLLAARPRLDVNVDWGDDGVAGTALEIFFDGVNTFRYVTGEMNIQDTTLVEDPVLGTVVKEIRVDNRHYADKPGAFSTTGYIRYQAGAGDYSFSINTPSFSRGEDSVHAGGSGYTRVYTGAENQYFPGSPDWRGGALFFHNLSAVREPGEMSTQVYYRFAGQPGHDRTGVVGPATFAALPGYYLFRWGYFPCECKERFGWELGTADFY